MMNLRFKDMKIVSRNMRRVLLAIFSYWLCALAQADDTLLQIKPNRCIALHEGQVCYQTLKITWNADAADTYCLYQQENKTPLICWENQLAGKGVYDFEGSATSKFFLLRKRDAKPVAEFTVEVAWVYDAKSHRESHWRIF